MRRQYHIRTVDGRRLVWDVHRLVRLSEHLPVERIPLSEIGEIDEDFWFWEQGGPVTCRQVAGHARLINETDLKHPIILSTDGRVMDGMHRVAKALLEGLESVRAVRFITDPAPDYVDVDLDTLPYDDLPIGGTPGPTGHTQTR